MQYNPVTLLMPKSITDQNAANAFVAGLKPGAIVSMQLGIPGEIKKKEARLMRDRLLINNQVWILCLPQADKVV